MLNPSESPEGGFRVFLGGYDKEHWDKEKEGVDGILLRILETFELAHQIAEDVGTEEASPANVSWVNFWTRYYELLRGIRASLGYRSDLSMTLLERCFQELHQHLLTIIEPWMNEETRQQVVIRLELYTAWSLYNDLQLLNQFGRGSTLDGVYDPKPGREFARWLGEKLPWYEDEFGEFEILGDYEAEVARKRAAKEIARRKEGLWNLVKELDLEARIKEMNKIKRSIGWPFTFYSVVHETNISVSHGRKLSDLDMSWAYSTYSLQSSVLHSTTLFLGTTSLLGNIITPKLDDDKDREATANRLVGHTRMAYGILDKLKAYIM